MFKIMIVDDEPLIRRGLSELIDWKAMDCVVVKEAVNGLEALEYIRQEPVDIVVSDIKMPRMTGLEFAEAVMEEHIRTKIILLTAFQEFSYAQAAIRLGVVQFVVKTNFIEELPKRICEVTEKIRQTRREEEQQQALLEAVEQKKKMLRESSVKDALLGISDFSRDHAGWEAEIAALSRSHFLVAVYHLKEEADQKLAENQAILNILVGATFQAYQAVQIPTAGNITASIIFRDSAFSPTDQQALTKLIVDMTRVLKSGKNITVTAGISSPHSGLEQLAEAYREAYAMAARNAFWGACDTRPQKTAPGAGQEAEALLSWLGDNASDPSIPVQTYIEKAEALFALSRESRFSPEKARAFGVDIYRAYGRHAGMPQVNTKAYQAELQVAEMLHECSSMEELMRKLREAIEEKASISQGSEGNRSALVNQAMAYLHGHYREKINLSFVAKQLHVNRNYLGSLYKKEVGESLNDTLNKLRIEHAQGMLSDPGYSISNISETVGFEDPAYFTNVFSKFVGISPSEYRRRIN